MLPECKACMSPCSSTSHIDQKPIIASERTTRFIAYLILHMQQQEQARMPATAAEVMPSYQPRNKVVYVACDTTTLYSSDSRAAVLHATRNRLQRPDLTDQHLECNCKRNVFGIFSHLYMKDNRRTPLRVEHIAVVPLYNGLLEICGSSSKLQEDVQASSVRIVWWELLSGDRSLQC